MVTFYFFSKIRQTIDFHRQSIVVLIVVFRDGHLKVVFRDGHLIVVFRDGNLIVVFRDGHLIVVFRDWHLIVVLRDGHLIVVFRDGHRIVARSKTKQKLLNHFSKLILVNIFVRTNNRIESLQQT